MVLQHLEEVRQAGLAHVEKLVAAKHGRNRLDPELPDLGLDEGAVDGLVTYVGVKQCDEVKCLNHVWAIGAGERHVGAQRNGPIEARIRRTMPSSGKFPSAVGIQNR